MLDDDLSRAREALLRDDVQTFDELELVLALARHAAQPRSIDALAADTGLPEDVLLAITQRLQSIGLVLEDGGYRLDETNAHRRRAIDWLVSEYDVNRSGVLSALSRNAIERVRTSAIRAFAKAFLLGRDPHDG